VKKIILLLVAVSGPTLASDWVSYGTSGDGIQLFIDMASLSRDGDYAKAWIELNYEKVKSEKARKSVELWKFDCREKTSITLYQVRYASNGAVISSRSTSETRYDYVPVAPDTFGEFVLKAACTS
jgi:hypothetical protein